MKLITLLVFGSLFIFSCEKNQDIVTSKVTCDNNYYVKYYNDDIDRFITTDTVTGNWEVNLNASFDREQVIKVYTFDSITSTIKIGVYLNDIYQGGTVVQQDSSSTRYALMIRSK